MSLESDMVVLSRTRMGGLGLAVSAMPWTVWSIEVSKTLLDLVRSATRRDPRKWALGRLQLLVRVELSRK